MIKEKTLDRAYLNYAGYVRGQNGSYLVYVHYDRGGIRTAVLRFEGMFIGESGVVHAHGVIGDVVCNASSPALASLLLPENGTTVVSWRLLLRPGGYLGVPSFTLAEPDRLLGFGPYYIGALYDKNGTIVASLNSTPIQALLYTKIGDRYVVYHAKLGGRGFEKLASSILNLTGCNLGNVDFFTLLLNDTNAIPDDQPWGLLFVSNFNALFPMSYGMVFAGILLLLYGWRRWR